MVAVNTRVVPAVRLAVEPLSASLPAAPVTTLHVIGLPDPTAKPPADARIVTLRGCFPVTVIVATPPAAVLNPRPVTLPPPTFVFANVTLSELFAPEVTVFPFAS